MIVSDSVPSRFSLFPGTWLWHRPRRLGVVVVVCSTNHLGTPFFTLVDSLPHHQLFIRCVIPTSYCNISMRFLPLLGGLVPLLGLVDAAPSCNHECNRACWTSRFNINTDYENEWPVTGVTRKVRFPKLFTRSTKVPTCSHEIPQYDFEITEVDEWVGPDGHIKKGAMLINGEI